MKNLIFPLISMFLAVSASASPSPKAPSMEKAEEVAAQQGFVEVSKRKAKDPFYSSKRADAKTWMSIDAYPQGSVVKQVALTCNQCKSRKMSEELAVECFGEAQKLATGLGVDIPGETVRAFEGKELEKIWELKDQAAKKVRFQRTTLKCDARGGSGIRFDIFYTE